MRRRRLLALLACLTLPAAAPADVLQLLDHAGDAWVVLQDAMGL